MKTLFLFQIQLKTVKLYIYNTVRRFKEADRNRSIRAKRASKEYRRQSLVAADSEKLRVRFKDLAADNCFASTEEKPRPVIPPKPNALRVKHPMARCGARFKIFY